MHFCLFVLGFPGITSFPGKNGLEIERTTTTGISLFPCQPWYCKAVLLGPGIRSFPWQTLLTIYFFEFQCSQLFLQCCFPKSWIKTAPVWDLLNLKKSGTPAECLITFALTAMLSDAVAADSGHLDLQAWPLYLVSIIPDRIQQLNLDLHQFLTPLASQAQTLPPAPGRLTQVHT